MASGVKLLKKLLSNETHRSRDKYFHGVRVAAVTTGFPPAVEGGIVPPNIGAHFRRARRPAPRQTGRLPLLASPFSIALEFG